MGMCRATMLSRAFMDVSCNPSFIPGAETLPLQPLHVHRQPGGAPTTRSRRKLAVVRAVGRGPSRASARGGQMVHAARRVQSALHRRRRDIVHDVVLFCCVHRTGARFDRGIARRPEYYTSNSGNSNCYGQCTRAAVAERGSASKRVMRCPQHQPTPHYL